MRTLTSVHGRASTHAPALRASSQVDDAQLRFEDVMSRMHCTRAGSGAPRSLAAVIMPSALSISRARRAPSRGAAPGRPRALGRAPAGRRARSLAKFRARATRRAAARKKSHRQGDARRPSAARAPRRRRAHSLGPPRVRDEMRVRSESGMSRRPWPRVALQRRRGGVRAKDPTRGCAQGRQPPAS